MSGSKRKCSDENAPFKFVHQSGAPQKHIRRVSHKIDQATLQELRNQRSLDDAREAEARKVEEVAAAALAASIAAEDERRKSTARVATVLTTIAAEYPALHDFLRELITTKDRAQSSQVSQMLISHAPELLYLMRKRQPETINHWVVETAAEILAEEGKRIADYLRPEQGEKVSEVLERFDLQKILAEVEELAPTLCKFLRKVAKRKESSESTERKDCDLVSIFKSPKFSS
jgi:hypothetical protein